MKKNNIITKIKISSDQKLIPCIKGIENEYDTSTLITNGGVIIKGGVNISNASILLNDKCKNKPKKINHSLPGTMGISNFYDNNINDCKNSFYGLIEDNKIIYFGEDKGINGQKGIKGNKGEKGIKGIFGQKGIRGQKGEEGYDPIIIFHGDLTEDLINYVENNYYPSYINNGSLDIKFNKLIGTEPFNPDSYNEWNNNLIYIQLVDNDKRNCDNDISCNSNENKYVKINCCSNNCGNCNNSGNSNGLSKYLIYWNGKSWSRSNYEFTALNGEVGQIGQIGLKGIFGNKGNKNIINNIGSKGYKGESATDSVNIKGDNPINGIRGTKGNHGFNSIIIYTGELNSILIDKIQDNNYPEGNQNNPTFNNLIGNESFNPNGYTKWNTSFKYIQYVTIDYHFNGKYTNLLFSYDGSNFEIMNVNNSQNNNFKGQKGSNNTNNTIGDNGQILNGDIGELSKVKGEIGFVNFNKEFKGSLYGCDKGFDINYNNNIIFNEQNPIARIRSFECSKETKPWYDINGGKITIKSLISSDDGILPPNESYNKQTYGCIKFNDCYTIGGLPKPKGTSFGNITPTIITYKDRNTPSSSTSINKPQLYNLLPSYNKKNSLYGSTQNNPIKFTDNNNIISQDELVSDSDGNKADTTYLSLPVYSGKSTDTTSIEASINNNNENESFNVSHYSNLYLPKIHPIDTESSDLSHYEYLNKPNIPNYVDLSGLIGIPEPIINSLPEDFFNTLTLTISEFEDDKKNDTEQITFNNIISIDNYNINYIISYNPTEADIKTWENSNYFPDINTNFLNLMQNKPYLIFCRKDSSTYNTLNKIELQITVNVNKNKTNNFSYFDSIPTFNQLHIDFINNFPNPSYLNNNNNNNNDINGTTDNTITFYAKALNASNTSITSNLQITMNSENNYSDIKNYIFTGDTLLIQKTIKSKTYEYNYHYFDFKKVFPNIDFGNNSEIELTISFGLNVSWPKNLYFYLKQFEGNLASGKYLLHNVKSITFTSNNSDIPLITIDKEYYGDNLSYENGAYCGFPGIINNIFQTTIEIVNSDLIGPYIKSLLNNFYLKQSDISSDGFSPTNKIKINKLNYSLTIKNIKITNTNDLQLFNGTVTSDTIPVTPYNKFFAWIYSGILGNGYYTSKENGPKYIITNCSCDCQIGLSTYDMYDYTNPYDGSGTPLAYNYAYYNNYCMCYGGIIGAVIFANNVTITNCSSTGEIGFGLTGGIVGCVMMSQCSISGCYTTSKCNITNHEDNVFDYVDLKNMRNKDKLGKDSNI